MSNTAYWVNCLAKRALSITEEEWKKIRDELSEESYSKILPVLTSVSLLRSSLDFTEEAEQVAEEVTA